MEAEYGGTPGEITALLEELAANETNDRRALDRLLPLVYTELKALARTHRYRWNGQARLGTTSLVHEAYARLAAQRQLSLSGRREFFCLASRAMRSILVDNARWHRREKRGGDARHEGLDDQILVSQQWSEELLALHDALSRFEEREPDLALIVECRCFGGLTVEETSVAVGASTATVKRRWRLAQAWLYREMHPSAP